MDFVTTNLEPLIECSSVATAAELSSLLRSKFRDFAGERDGYQKGKELRARLVYLTEVLAEAKCEVDSAVSLLNTRATQRRLDNYFKGDARQLSLQLIREESTELSEIGKENLRRLLGSPGVSEVSENGSRQRKTDTSSTTRSLIHSSLSEATCVDEALKAITQMLGKKGAERTFEINPKLILEILARQRFPRDSQSKKANLYLRMLDLIESNPELALPIQKEVGQAVRNEASFCSRVTVVRSAEFLLEMGREFFDNTQATDLASRCLLARSREARLAGCTLVESPIVSVNQSLLEEALRVVSTKNVGLFTSLKDRYLEDFVFDEFGTFESALLDESLRKIHPFLLTPLLHHYSVGHGGGEYFCRMMNLRSLTAEGKLSIIKCISERAKSLGKNEIDCFECAINGSIGRQGSGKVAVLVLSAIESRIGLIAEQELPRVQRMIEDFLSAPKGKYGENVIKRARRVLELLAE